MKFLQVILSMSFLFLLPLLVVGSSSLNHTSSVNNITRDSSSLSTSLNDTSLRNGTRGSSISPSLNDASFVPSIRRGSSISTWNLSSRWLSPSGNIAFGFYKETCPDSSPHCPDQYGVGIYFAKSKFPSMVWTTNRYYYEQSLILFTTEGKLVLRTKSDNKEEPLIPNMQEPVSYAMMLDNGNFVLYGSGSKIIWQSFDYPTDTILGGQKLRSGVDLISGRKKLSVQELDGSVAIYAKRSDSVYVSVISDALKGSLSRPVFLSLNTTGDLYLVGSDDVVLKYLYRDKNQRRKQQEEGAKEGVYMFRARLYSAGYFSLYKERIDGHISDHEETSIPVQSWPIYHMSTLEICVIALLAFFGFCVLLMLCYAVVKA